MKRNALFLATALLAFAILFTSCDESIEKTTEAPKTTAVLGETTEAPHTHSFSSWSVTKNATCTEVGSEERICSCGEKETKTISATGHSYKDGKCSTCGQKDTSLLDVDQIYKEAIDLLNSGKYQEAYEKFLGIKDKKDVSEYIARFVWILTEEQYTNHSGTYKSSIKYEYDENGNIVKATETESGDIEHITTYTYKKGLLKETARWTVGTNDNLITEYIYDKNGLLEQKNVWSSVEDAEYSIIYEYNSKGELVKLTNNNFYVPYVEEFSYDTSGRLVQSTLKDDISSTTTKYEYDSTGLLIKQTTNYYDGEGYITYNYDSNGNMILKSESNGTKTEYSYKLIYTEQSEDENYGTFSVIDGYDPQWISWSNGEVFAIEHEGKYIFINKDGKIVAGPFDSVMCPDLNGYMIGYVFTSEIVETDMEYDDGIFVDVEKRTTKAYVYDSLGNLIFEATGARTDYGGFEITYEGEYIENCSEGRIITLSYNDYYIGAARNSFSVNIYDMNGKKIAEFKDIYSVGSYINGKLVMVNSYGYIISVDRDGKEVASITDLRTKHPLTPTHYFAIFDAYIGDGHHMSYFPGGYMIIEIETYSDEDSFYHLLISEDMNTSYLIKKEYIYDNRNYGTLVFSKIVENGTISSAYYLIDVSKCAVDDQGMIIPSRDAAVCDKEFASGSFYNVFNQTEKYALVSTSDGKWGFLSMDGKILNMFDDASYFSGGFAAVKDEDVFYVIDEDFNRVSDTLTGYDSVSVVGNGIFVLNKGDSKVIAVYTE